MPEKYFVVIGILLTLKLNINLTNLQHEVPDRAVLSFPGYAALWQNPPGVALFYPADHSDWLVAGYDLGHIGG